MVTIERVRTNLEDNFIKISSSENYIYISYTTALIYYDIPVLSYDLIVR